MAKEPGTVAIVEQTIDDNDDESFKPHLVETEDEWIQEDDE
jgi:hypothetical protein